MLPRGGVPRPMLHESLTPYRRLRAPSRSATDETCPIAFSLNADVSPSRRPISTVPRCVSSVPTASIISVIAACGGSLLT